MSTGFDINFLQNRIGLEFTYYKTNSKNQLINVATPPASGYSSKFINAGNVENKGIEITLNVTPIKNAGFHVVVLCKLCKKQQQGCFYLPGSPEFELDTDGFMTRTKVVEGKPFGEMYSRGYVRDSATGQIIVVR